MEAKTQWYLDHRADRPASIDGVCLYAVECSSGYARMQRVEDLDSFDFDNLRDTIWERKFEGVCQGQTANLAIRIHRRGRSDGDGHDETLPERDIGVWFFPSNRFLPSGGRWSSLAFSRRPWTPCSLEAATFRVEDGSIIQR